LSGPLDGIRVIDCCRWQMGPVAAAMLGDLGADVIKIEPPISGDPGRGSAVTARTTGGVDIPGYVLFEIWNRNKRGITLDLTKEKGQEVIYRLVGSADVLIHNWRKGVAEKLKADYESLSKYNPKLIYVIVTGWGSKGPESGERAMDFTGLARSGMPYLAGGSDDPPMIFVSGLADQTGAMITVQGVLSALVARERQQIGQVVETSLLGSMVAGLESFPVQVRATSGQEMPRRDRAKMPNPLWSYYRCSDGKWIALAALQADRFWPSFCKALGIEELEHDPRFRDAEVRSQVEHCEELIRTLDKNFATRPSQEWLKVLREHSIICGPVQTISDLLTDPQVQANEYIMDYDHPIYGRIKTVGLPWKFSETPASLRLPAPQLGQHTEEVLLEIGYTWDDIAELKEQEVI